MQKCCEYECDVCLQFSNLHQMVDTNGTNNTNNIHNTDDNIKINEDWKAIKNTNKNYTDREYEYACVQNVLALRWIPKNRQTKKMLQCAFRKRDQHIWYHQTGTSTDNDECYNLSIYKFPIKDSINSDLLTKNMYNYIISNGYEDIIEHSHDQMLTNTNLNTTLNTNLNIQLEFCIERCIECCKSTHDLIKLTKNKYPIINPYSIPTDLHNLINLEWCVTWCNKSLEFRGSKLLDIYDLIKNFIIKNNLEINLEILFVHVIMTYEFKPNTTDITEILKNYKKLITNDMLKNIIVTYGKYNTHVLTNVLNYLNPNLGIILEIQHCTKVDPYLYKINDNEYNTHYTHNTYDIELAYELIKLYFEKHCCRYSASVIPEIFKNNRNYSYSYEDNFTFNPTKTNGKIYLTSELEIKLLKTLVVNDPEILVYLNSSSELSYDEADNKYYQLVMSHIDNDIKNIGTCSVSTFQKNFETYCRINDLPTTKKTFYEYELEKKLFFTDFLQIVLSSNFSKNLKPYHIPNQFFTKEIIAKLIKCDYTNLYYFTDHSYSNKKLSNDKIISEMINNLDDFLNLEELYEYILKLKTFYSFLLIKKYRTFRFYSMSVQTYIDSVLLKKELNPHYYNSEENYEWYNYNDLPDFFRGHNMNNEELFILAKQLVSVNGLFLKHIEESVKMLSEEQQTDIYNTAKLQNIHAMRFCNHGECYSCQTLPKTIENLNLAINNLVEIK